MYKSVDGPAYIMTKDGIKPIKITKYKYDERMGVFIIKEYEILNEYLGGKDDIIDELVSK